MVLDMELKTPYMILYMDSEIQQKWDTLQPNEGFSIHYHKC